MYRFIDLPKEILNFENRLFLHSNK